MLTPYPKQWCSFCLQLSLLSGSLTISHHQQHFIHTSCGFFLFFLSFVQQELYLSPCSRIKSVACLRRRISPFLHVEMHRSHLYDWINMFYLFIPLSDPFCVLSLHRGAVFLMSITAAWLWGCCIFFSLPLALSAERFIVLEESFVLSELIYFINKMRENIPTLYAVRLYHLIASPGFVFVIEVDIKNEKKQKKQKTNHQ